MAKVRVVRSKPKEPPKKESRFVRWYRRHRTEFNELRSARRKAKPFTDRAALRRGHKNPTDVYRVQGGNKLVYYAHLEKRFFYAPTVAARMAGVRVDYIRVMQDAGRIPNSVLVFRRGTKQVPLFSAPQVQAIQHAAAQWGWKRAHKNVIYEYLLSRWHDDDEDCTITFPEKEFAAAFFDKHLAYRIAASEGVKARQPYRDAYARFPGRRARGERADKGDGNTPI